MRAHPSRGVLLLAFGLAAGLAGCASSGGVNRVVGSTSNRIVMAELEGLGKLDALQAVQRLRPRWLQSRGDGQPTLYVDGAPRGNVEDLRFMPSDQIEQIDYLSASDATNRFGTGHQGGAILVVSRR